MVTFNNIKINGIEIDNNISLKRSQFCIEFKVNCFVIETIIRKSLKSWYILNIEKNFFRINIIKFCFYYSIILLFISCI